MICRSIVCRTRTKMIIFLGTPHRRSSSAEWGQIASNIAHFVLRDSNLIKDLKVNSVLLDSINDAFETAMNQSQIRIHSFQEAQGMGVKGFHNKVCCSRALKVPSKKGTYCGLLAGCRRFLFEARSAERDCCEHERKPHSDAQIHW